MPRSRESSVGVVRRLAILMTAVAISTVACSSTAGSTSPKPTANAWKTVWRDDFNGAPNSRTAPENWIYDIGRNYPGANPTWGSADEIDTTTDSTENVYQDGSGHLVIKPIRDGAGNWTSGRIESRRTDFQAPAGGKLRIEASLQLPPVSGSAATGYWPSFWMLGAPFLGDFMNWPGVGEIDIVENRFGADQVWGTLHCGTNPGGPCNEPIGFSGNKAGCPGNPCQSGFHKYTVESDRSVSPEQLRWYVDGLQYYTVDADRVGQTAWSKATDHGFVLILNVAIGGPWAGKPTPATASGVPMVIDYVAVYSFGGSDVS